MALPALSRRILMQRLMLTLGKQGAACARACRTAYATVYGMIERAARRTSGGAALTPLLAGWRQAGIVAWNRWADAIVQSRAAKTLKELGQRLEERPEGQALAPTRLQLWGRRLREIARRLAGLGVPSGSRGGLEPPLARRLLLGLSLIGLLALSCGVWATTTPIAGAVIASGLVVVESNIKKVQHSTGGIVAEIAVKNGDRVKAGDVVLQLDDTQARANLGIVVSQLVQLTGRKARLEAERDQAAVIRFPADFLASGDEAAADRARARSGCSISAGHPSRARSRS